MLLDCFRFRGIEIGDEAGNADDAWEEAVRVGEDPLSEEWEHVFYWVVLVDNGQPEVDDVRRAVAVELLEVPVDPSFSSFHDVGSGFRLTELLGCNIDDLDEDGH